MTVRGILACSAYLPRRRLSRAAIAHAHEWARGGQPRAGRRAMAAWDEDSLTMAVEAGRLALAGQAPPEALVFASTTPPFADRLGAGIAATALDLPAELIAQDVGGGLRAASSALLRGLSGDRSLIISGEKRSTKPGSGLESQSADAGAAVLLGSGDVIAECLGCASMTADFVDHYRQSPGDADYVLEDRWLRDSAVLKFVPDTVGRALAKAGLAAEAVDTALFALPNPQHAKAAAAACGLRADALRDALSHDCGSAGAAHPLLALAEAIEAAKPGQILLLVSFGQGCDALLFRATEKLAAYRPRRPVARQLAEGVTEDNYLRFLSHANQIDLEWGLRAERDNRTAQSVAWRKSRDVYSFIGGRCRNCGTVQFPRSRCCVNPDCRTFDSQEAERLADVTGTIKTFTDDWQAFTPDPPLRYGNIRLEGGGNVLMELTDCPESGLRIGQPVRMAFRLKDADEKRRFRRYFWKAVPLAEEVA